VEGPFNFSRLMNRAAGQATGDYVLFLNDDTEVGPGWLEAMLEAAELPGVGVVGAKLLYPSGEVQHAGVVLGIGQVAGHSHKFWPGTSAGCLGSLAVLRNYSAVDGACLLVRRRLFEEAGGFDEELGGHFQDVDFCLRVARRGYRTVFTPFAVVTHVEEASGQRPVRSQEAAHMEARWGYELADDPHYHPLLTRRQEGFDIDVWRGRPAGWLRRLLEGRP
jgi:GT2 family glycosyltransferase